MRRKDLKPSAEYNAREHAMDECNVILFALRIIKHYHKYQFYTNFKNLIFRIKHFHYTNVSKYSSQCQKEKGHTEQIRQKKITRKRNIDRKT